VVPSQIYKVLAGYAVVALHGAFERLDNNSHKVPR
jgi:hypothetical protein